MGLGQHLRSIKEAFQTIGEGMAVTASHMVRKPVTLEYPDRLPEGVRVQDTLPFRYRGMLEVDLEICTACLACECACPIDCIVIDAEKDKAAGGLVMTRFDIDMGSPCASPTGGRPHDCTRYGAGCVHDGSSSRTRAASAAWTS